MQNVKLSQTGPILTIEIDTSKTFGRTKKGEGKNTSVASTGGNAKLVVGEVVVCLGLNAYIEGTSEA